LNWPKYSILTAYTYWETTLNTDFGIKNERQHCKIGLVREWMKGIKEGEYGLCSL
jgi:hypothetical protein